MSTPRIVSLLVFFVVAAVTAYGYIDHPDFNDVFGAGLHAGCKEPCDDSGVRYMNECMDENGEPPCDDRAFMENTFRYVTCATTGETGDCALSIDNGQWMRYVIYKRAGDERCPSGGPVQWDFGDCEGCPSPGIYTPCVTDETWGEIISPPSPALTMGRIICTP
jgi:hypothetical protein